jgi:hypothetical protein
MFTMLRSSHTLYTLLLEQGTWCAAAYLQRRLVLAARRLEELPTLPNARERVKRHEVAALAAAFPVLQQLSVREEAAGGVAGDEGVLRALMSMQLVQSMFTSGCWELVWAQFSSAQKRQFRTVLLPDLVRLLLTFDLRATRLVCLSCCRLLTLHYLPTVPTGYRQRLLRSLLDVPSLATPPPTLPPTPPHPLPLLLHNSKPNAHTHTHTLTHTSIV